MTALVLTLQGKRCNSVEVAQQDYNLAEARFRDVCDRFDATSENGVSRFHAAQERREDARERYIVELHG